MNHLWRYHLWAYYVSLETEGYDGIEDLCDYKDLLIYIGEYYTTDMFIFYALENEMRQEHDIKWIYFYTHCTDEELTMISIQMHKSNETFVKEMSKILG